MTVLNVTSDGSLPMLFGYSIDQVFLLGLFLFILLVGIAKVWEILRLNHPSYADDYESRNSDIKYTKIKSTYKKPTKKPSKTFKLNKFKRYCGVEIECIDEEGITDKRLQELNFNEVDDGSLSDDGREYVSLPSQGDRLFNMIDGLTKELSNIKAYTDKSCGLHIHLEVEKDLELLKKIFLFYDKYEDYFFKMMPLSRRNSHYAMRSDKVYGKVYDKILNSKDLDEFWKIIYETRNSCIPNGYKYNDKRYCWVNFHSVFYRSTLELRNHSGTINSGKIKNWLTINLIILDYISKHSLKHIDNMKLSEEAFLSLFPKKIKDYIELRWNKFRYSDSENKVEVKK